MTLPKAMLKRVERERDELKRRIAERDKAIASPSLRGTRKQRVVVVRARDKL